MRKCNVSPKEARSIVMEARKNLGLVENSMLWSRDLEAECILIHAQTKGAPQSPTTIPVLAGNSRDTAKKQQRIVNADTSATITSCTDSSGDPVSPRKRVIQKQQVEADRNGLESPPRDNTTVSSTTKLASRSKSVGARTERILQRVANATETESTAHHSGGHNKLQAKTSMRSSDIEENYGLDTSRSKFKPRQSITTTEGKINGLEGSSMHSTRSRSRVHMPLSEDSLLDTGRAVSRSRTKDRDISNSGTDTTARRSKSKSRRSSETYNDGLESGTTHSTRSKARTRQSPTNDSLHDVKSPSPSNRSRSTTRIPKDLLSSTAPRSKSKSRTSTTTTDYEKDFFDNGISQTTRSSSKCNEIDEEPHTVHGKSKSKMPTKALTDYTNPSGNGNARSKSVTRRPTSDEEQESRYCQTHPKLHRSREESNQGQSGRLDTELRSNKSENVSSGGSSPDASKIRKRPVIEAARADVNISSQAHSGSPVRSGSPSRYRMIPSSPMRACQSNIQDHNRASSPDRSASPSKYRMVPGSPCRASKGPGSILHRRTARNKIGLPTPSLHHRENEFPSATKFTANTAKMNNLNDSSFSHRRMNQTDSADPFHHSQPKRNAENPHRRSTEDNSHRLRDREEDVNNRFGGTFESSKPVFPEFSQNTSIRDTNHIFDKQDPCAPRPPQRQKSYERLPLRKTAQRTISNGSLSSANSSNTPQRKTVKVRRQTKVKKEKSARKLVCRQ